MNEIQRALEEIKEAMEVLEPLSIALEQLGEVLEALRADERHRLVNAVERLKKAAEACKDISIDSQEPTSLEEQADALEIKEKLEREDFEVWWGGKYSKEPKLESWVKEIAFQAWYSSTCMRMTPRRVIARRQLLEAVDRCTGFIKEGDFCGGPLPCPAHAYSVASMARRISLGEDIDQVLAPGFEPPKTLLNQATASEQTALKEGTWLI